MNNSVELWKKNPYIDKIEVSSFGRVRSVKGHYYKNSHARGGYLQVGFRMNEEDYKKFKELKEKYDISWTKFIEFASKLIEKDLKNNGN